MMGMTIVLGDFNLCSESCPTCEDEGMGFLENMCSSKGCKMPFGEKEER